METRRGTSPDFLVALQIQTSVGAAFHVRGFPPEGSGLSGKLAMLGVFPPRKEELMAEHPKELSVYLSVQFCKRTRSRGVLFFTRIIILSCPS